MISAVFRALQRHATLVMAACLFLGLAVPPLAAALSPVVFPFAVGTMLLSLTRLDWRAAGALLQRPLLPIGIVVAAMVVAPVVVHAVSEVLAAGHPLATGATLMASAPPLLSAPAYALLLRVDAALAMVASVPANLLTPVVMPVMVASLVDVTVDISAADLAGRLAVMVGCAFGGAWLMRKVMGTARIEHHAHYVDGLMLVLLCSFGIGVMDGIRDLVVSDPAAVASAALAAFGLSIALQAATIALGWRLGARTTLTAAMLMGLRNGILVLGAVGDAAGPEVKLFLIAFQFPLYILPALMRVVFGRLMGL
ncbi:MAG: hypothetical protein H6983_12375 [Ectothiorhodospiraceae bacterium]|nr:hypothetical protein [Chromatiales bacterium]MCP5154957.1 hypothetical protein [Ectothiorhodospiraceae bacterium]